MLGAIPNLGYVSARLFKEPFGRLLLRNTTTKSNLFIHTLPSLNTRFKGAVPTAVTTHDCSQDILLQNMRVSKDSSDVLNAINRHHSIMNGQHALQGLKSLFSLQKTHNSRISNGQVVNSKDFRKLCEILRSQIRHLELNELIDIVKCMGFLGVPADSKILNTVLNILSKKINDMSLQQIIFLDFIIKDFKSTPIVKAIKIAMPIVFEANMPSKCDFDNISQVCDLLSFVSKRKYMVKSTDILIDALIDRREELNLKDACNIAFSLCDSRTFNSNNYHLLLCYALDYITDSIDQMDFFEIESLLSKLCTRYLESNGDMSFYHEEFCNCCLQSVIKKDYSFEHTLWILKKIIKFNHVNLPFLDYIARKAESEPWQLEQCGAAGFINFLNAFSLADYKPPNWDRIKPLVIKASQGFMDRTELPWFRVVLDLCILDCWVEEILIKMFSREFLTLFMARDNNLDRKQLLFLDQVSATLSPWPIKPRAPSDIIAPITGMVGTHLKTFTLEAALTQGLGGPEYLKSGVLTNLGHFLDHIVVLRKGGFPAAINLKNSEFKERISTDDIQVTADSTMVAIFFVPGSMCSNNNERVRGLIRIQINSIEALNIAVVPILQPVWNALPDYERIPYLMRAIKEKAQDSEITNSALPV